MPADRPSSARSAQPEPTPGTRPTGVIARDIDELVDTPLPWEQLFGTTVLITGAGGMIPAYVARTLLRLNDTRRAGIRVLGLVRDPSSAREVFSDVIDRDDFAIVQGDVSHPVRLDTHVDLVIHGASPARPHLHATAPVDTIRANVQGTLNLLELCRDAGGARFVLMSSAEVYGRHPIEGGQGGLLTEDSYGAVDILNPRASYTEGKRAAETIAASYHAQYGIPITLARFGHIFGPGMALDDGRVQADFTADVVAGRDITLHSDGSARRTYTYLADAVSGLFAALLLGADTAYNVSDRDGFVSIRELAEAFARARPAAALRVGFREPTDATRGTTALGAGLDDARLRALGWAPHVGLEKGIDRTIAWHEERRSR
ncbi:NAD-dependent epimerase/dehydratase family protein [Microbacterium sp. bgisy189]|uniref:NAD-dependent epimerase/dehydratase family protein n=1 Tax=Microbacterium sp. bgisy189 TaxID=3413798 RepID=UPI003EBD7E99